MSRRRINPPGRASVRVAPAMVLRWVAGDIDGRALLLNIKALHSDPDWRVQSVLGHTRWDIDLIHWPSGSTDTIHLEPVAGSNDAIWRRIA